MTSISRNNITLPKTEIPVTMETDIVVVGGGPAGFGAAVRAAQNNVPTLLIERFGGPGGNATTGFMCCIGATSLPPDSKAYPFGSVHKEFVKGLKKEDWLFDAFNMYPQAKDNPIVHSSGAMNFQPDMGAYVMNEIMEANGVDFLYRTHFVDAIVEEEKITALIVDNASGRQAIKAKIFVDATGRADVTARAGAPFIDPGCHDDECIEMTGAAGMGRPIPGSLMYKISGVDYERLFEYQKDDPTTEAAIQRARENGDIPVWLYRPYPERVFGSLYKGHAHLDMCPLAGGPGEMIVWTQIPYEWELNCAINGEDASHAEVEMRKLIVAEGKFLKKYVPGFETSWISGIAPLMGLREGRHPLGEYIYTYDDFINERKFEDAALIKTSHDTLAFKKPGKPLEVKFEVPYRCFLPKKIDNLLLAGECLSYSREVLIHAFRTITGSMMFGEVAGEAAALSVKKGIAPKRLKWSAPFIS